MRISRLLPPIALTAAGALAACADATAPLAGPAPTAPGVAIVAEDTTVSRFTIDPQKMISLGLAGDHKVFFPAQSICDPAVSSYGPGTWDEPCTLLTTPIEITTRSYTTPDGRARVDFTPALRFVTGAMGRNVTVHLLDPSAVRLTRPTIYYCPDGADASACVDEGATDPSLATQVDGVSGVLSRRIKHFSGYSVGVGRTEDGTY